MGRLQVQKSVHSELLKTEVQTVQVKLGRESENRFATFMYAAQRKTQTNHSIGDSTGAYTKNINKVNAHGDIPFHRITMMPDCSS